MKGLRIDINTDFKCQHCGSYVSAARFIAGVGNRNHCPYCLWSRHMDLFEAGDRLAACKAPMRPVGLTLKRSRNKYASAANGELMLVHKCTDCERSSINRIAADDISDAIMEVYEASLKEPTGIKEVILAGGIHLLGDESFEIVCQQLYGELSRPVMLAVPAV